MEALELRRQLTRVLQLCQEEGSSALFSSSRLLSVKTDTIKKHMCKTSVAVTWS